MPDELLAHTGTPDVEDEPENILRHPDVIVIAWADLGVEGSADPRTVFAAIEIVSRSNPENDWVGKVRDYPLMGIPRLRGLRPPHRYRRRLHGHPPHPGRPRYATRKDFVYGEDVTIADWTISTEGLPLYG